MDLHTAFTFADMMQRDGIHPTAKGAGKIADIIYTALTTPEKELKAAAKKSAKKKVLRKSNLDKVVSINTCQSVSLDALARFSYRAWVLRVHATIGYARDKR